MGSLEVAGGIQAEGHGSDAVHVRDDTLELSGIDVAAADGRPIVRDPRP